MSTVLPPRPMSDLPWHARPAADVMAALHSADHGLTAADVEARRRRHGRNQLEEEPPPSMLAVALRQFRSPLIFILLAATLVTVALGEHLDAAVIAAVLAINATIGTVQERKAEGAVRALKQMVITHALVVREGQERQIDSWEIVPGDIVLLEPGSRVPADLRLLAANAVQIDESLLTGESLPVAKRAGAVTAGAPLADRTSMAFTGTVVVSGRARGVTVATGADTELGAIAGLIRSEPGAATPLQRRMDHFAKVVGAVVATAAVVAFASGVLLGGSANEMFLTAVALAVSAVPEGLPVAVTITLAIGVSRMARRNAILRRLPAVETLGSTTVIGSDKTGTLTQNRMTVERVWAGGQIYRWVAEGDEGGFVAEDSGTVPPATCVLADVLFAGVMTNEAEVYRVGDEVATTGDPTEVALLLAAMSTGLIPEEARQNHPIVAEMPFEPERRYSATIREHGGTQTVYVKGAPERVVAMCTHWLDEHGPTPIDPEAVHRAARALAADGLRVLALAQRRLPRPVAEPAEMEEPGGLVLLGLQGMLDPPRPGVREAVAMCHDAGIRVAMITGDHAITARAVARDLGIAPRDTEVLTGTMIAGLDAAGLTERVGDTNVFARVAPEQKLQIVRALGERGEVVAVTGDGVNDAPALKAAAIGVAMGRSGTDVAREAADMVLADDNFVTIAAAVEEGRITFDNIRKVTLFLVSTGAAEVAAILVSVWLGWPLLLLPAQLLWLNLVTNGLQDIALAFEPGEPGVLRRPPRRPSEGVLSRTLWMRTALTGIVMAIGTLVMFRWELARAGSLASAQTVALTTLVVFQAFQAGNARSEEQSLFRLHPLSNRWLFGATLVAGLVHLGALHFGPAQYVLRVVPIPLDAWVRIFAMALTVVVAVELHKVVRRRRASRERRPDG